MIADMIEMLVTGAASEAAARFEGWGMGMVAINLDVYSAACDVRFAGYYV